MSGPLAGVTIVELGGIGPGPFCGMVLADLGATVIRLDRPGAKLSAAMSVMCRGKQSLAIDLRAPGATEVVRRLVVRADATIEGFRPGVTERLGIGPADCHDWNPRLVYGRMTGWGQTGPYEQVVGHDINYLALTGVLDCLRGSDGSPVFPMNLVGDFGGGGMILALGIACALVEADRSGRGQVIDAAMVDGINLLTASLRGAMASGRWSRPPGHNYLDGGSPFYNVYRTADDQFLAVGAVEPEFYERLVEKLELTAPLGDQHDESSWPQTKRRFAEVFASRTREEWLTHFGTADVCVTPVLTLGDAAVDEHLIDRGVLIEVEGIEQPAPAPRFSRTAASVRHGARPLGADTNDILLSLDYSADQVDEFFAAAVVA